MKVGFPQAVTEALDWYSPYTGRREYQNKVFARTTPQQNIKHDFTEPLHVKSLNRIGVPASLWCKDGPGGASGIKPRIGLWDIRGPRSPSKLEQIYREQTTWLVE